MDVTIIWNDDPGENIEHVAEHSLTPAEVDEVLRDDSIPTAFSNSSGSPCKFGFTSTGKHIIVIWTEVNSDPRMILPANRL